MPRESPLRRCFPPSGRRYELFDTSVLLLVFALIGYVLTDPPSNTAEALQAPLRVINETELGILVAIAATFAVVTAYTGRWVRWGYVAVTTAAGALCLNFLVGYLTTDASDRTLLSVVLYGWIARRLMRDNQQEAV